MIYLIQHDISAIGQSPKFQQPWLLKAILQGRWQLAVGEASKKGNTIL